MSDYIKHPMIKPNKIQSRVYQQILFSEAVKQDTIIILPTGLGKTVIMILAIAHFLRKFDGKVVVTAPTRPLVDQHYNSFIDMLDILEDDISIISGGSPPKKRSLMWHRSKILIATPQTLRNDIISGICNLKEISLMCFDEVHRAIGDDPYVLSAEQYQLKNPNGRVIGFTASPKDKDKLREIVKNLKVRNIKFMNEEDPKVKKYIHVKASMMLILPFMLWKVSMMPIYLFIKRTLNIMPMGTRDYGTSPIANMMLTKKYSLQIVNMMQNC